MIDASGHTVPGVDEAPAAAAAPTCLVLWDVDLTLVNAGGFSGHSLALAMRRRYGRQLRHDAVPMAGRTDRAILADVLRRHGIDDSEAQLDGLRAELEVVLPEAAALLRTRGYALPGAAAALAALARRPWAVQSLLTGNIRPYAQAKVGAFGLDTFLDLDCGAYGWAHAVRAELVPVARAAASRRHGGDFSGRATVLVGDTPLDVEAALLTGAGVVAVASGAYPPEALRDAGAHAVLTDLRDTDLVVDTIARVGGAPQGG